jgi:formyltetrahydrofolate hydrolase
MTNPTATLLISCPDQRGLVAKFVNFIYGHNGNIIHADQHTDFGADFYHIPITNLRNRILVYGNKTVVFQ